MKRQYCELHIGQEKDLLACTDLTIVNILLKPYLTEDLC